MEGWDPAKLEPEDGAAGARLSFQDRIVAIADQLGAGKFGILNVAKRANLDVVQLVSRRVVRGEGRILLLLECVHQRLRIVLLAHCCHLYEVVAG